MKKTTIWIFAVCIAVLSFFVWKISSANTNDDIPQLRKYSNRVIDICTFPGITSLNQDSLIVNFPYDQYLDSCNYWNIISIKKDLSCLDQLFKELSANRETLSKALTSKLGSKLSEYLSPYQPDSLLILVQWAEKFKNYAELDVDNKIFYESLYDYWMDTISSKLSKATEEKPSIKYNFKFKYLQTRCVEQRISPATKKTSSEKVFENLIYNKWGHLINASWNQTSIVQKVLFLIFLIVFITGCFYTINKLIKFISKHIKHE